MSKQGGDSYVGMGYTVCPFCGNKSGEMVLLDRRLRNTFKTGEDVACGAEPCNECAGLVAEGRVCLIEINNGKDGGGMKLGDANRTGNLAWLQRDAFCHVFSSDIAPEKPPIVFVEVGVLAALQAMVAESHD